MEGDQTRETLDRLIKEAEKREQQQKAAETWNKPAATRRPDTSGTVKGPDQAGKEMRDKPREGAADHRSARERERREAALTPEQRAERAELRKSIEEGIAGLPNERRDLLKDPAATIELDVPRRWFARADQVRDVLGQIPEIKTRHLAISSPTRDEAGREPNAIARFDVLKEGETAFRSRGQAPEGAERLTPEQRAERAELRKSIEEGIQGLTKEKRDFLKDHSATIELRVPHGWYLRPADVDGVLRQMPEIKAGAIALEEATKDEARGRLNAIMGIDVYTAETVAEAQRKLPEGAERLGAEERAERRRIANPDNGIGCRFGEVPDHQDLLDWWEKRLSTDVKRDAFDPTKTLVVESFASAPGTREANKAIADRRGQSMEEFLLSQGVVAKIVVRSHGSEQAKGDPDKDDATRRVILVQSAESGSGEGRAEPGAGLPGVNEIPEEYKRNYVMDQPQADRLISEARESFRRGDYGGLLQRDEGADPKAHDADLDRYVREFQRIGHDDPHKALFEVKPWKGFLRDLLEDRRLREPIRGVMDTCGFGRTGRENWLKHWIRRGAS